MYGLQGRYTGLSDYVLYMKVSYVILGGTDSLSLNRLIGNTHLPFLIIPSARRGTIRCQIKRLRHDPTGIRTGNLPNWDEML